MKIKGLINLPTTLVEILQKIGDPQKEDIIQDPERRVGQNKTNYLSSMKRKVDIVLLCVFYGLYSSKKLPSMNESNQLEKDGFSTYDFNVNIETEANKFRHLMFSLWLSQNEIPENKLTLDFRKKMYSFLEKILDDEFIIKVAFPFYLSVAAEPMGDISFVDRIGNSGHVEWRLHPYAPERLALDFERQRKDFAKFITSELDEMGIK